MLYLEDYLEMIENLPMEMRDRFTEMREMDLQVENAMDSLDERVKGFFKKCGSVPNLKQDWKDEQMGKIKQEYQKALEDADEKVQLANQMYELVERHLRKLDQEVAKFKMELEADNSGITEILERRAMEADKPMLSSHSHKAEKRKYSSTRLHGSDRLHQTLAADYIRDTGSYSLSTKSNSSTTSSPANAMFESSQKQTLNNSTSAAGVNYSLGQVVHGSNAAIAVAASRAIGATLEMQQGRRSASLKASYVAVSNNIDITKDMPLGRDINSSTKMSSTGNKISVSTDSPITIPTKSSTKKKTSSSSRSSHGHHYQHQNTQQQLQLTAAASAASLAADHLTTDLFQQSKADDKTSSSASASGVWQVDPNEPRYCICNDVSYGDMVGCDNEDCPQEWFHYGCVGLLQAPRGKWYCPQCLASMKRRGRK